MNISFHPLYRSVASELRDFLKREGINLDVNYVIGGDGALLLYKSLSQPNLLISPSSSRGYYSACRIDKFRDFIKEYAKNPSMYHKECTGINVAINGVAIDSHALNEILIEEGLHKVTKISLSFNNGPFISESSNSGLIVYTDDGLNGWSPKLSATHYGHDSLGVAAVLPLKNDLFTDSSIRLEGKLRIRFLDRNRVTHLKMLIDCIDVDPYDASCTDRSNVIFKPYDLRVTDEVSVWKSIPFIIVKRD